MESRLLEILVCPVCKGPLRHQRARARPDGGTLDGELSCAADRLAFPIRDGIPRMMVDEARQLDDGECAS